MREIVDRLLKGQFEYTRGGLEFSLTRLELLIHEGEEIEGSFMIMGPQEKVTEGIVSSTELRMEVLTGHFHGEKDEVMYRFRGDGLSGGDSINGEFRIISNRGEYMLPFTVTVEKAKVFSSLGDIRNLFHFANLAKSNWEEALHLFYSPSFCHVLTGNDAQYESMYYGLSMVKDSNRNMEEFLLGVNKKQPISYISDVNFLDMEDPEGLSEHCITLSKNGWGYAYLEVLLDGDCLEADKLELTEADFSGNTGYFHFRLNADKLHSGKNLCRITFRGPQFEMTVPVTARVSHKLNTNMTQYLEKKRMTTELMRLYIKFRCRKSNSREWLSDTGKLITRMFALDENDIEFQLYSAQYLITAGRINQGQYSLEEIRKRIEEMLKNGEPDAEVMYCYFLYLQTLISREESDINKAALIIEEVYKRNPENWRIAWILQYVSEEFAVSPQRKWALLQEQYQNGCHSPMIYLDALHVLRGNVSLLSHLDEFELAVLSFATREGILTLSIIEQIVYLSTREKTFNPHLYRILKSCYEIQPGNDTLEAICSLLMKGECCDEESFGWYRMGVEQQLRITRLYEHYMMSITADDEGKPICDINKMVLMYFSYQSTLDWQKNAILYRYIYEHREEYPELFEAYKFQIEKYLLNEIDRGHISLALGYLYQHLITRQMVDATNAPKLLALLYMTRIMVIDPSITEVIVVYDKCSRQMHYPLQNGIANLPLYGNEYTLLFADAQDNRYVVSTLYESTKMMNPGELAQFTIPFIQKGKENLDLFLCELGTSAYTITMENASRYRDLAGSDMICESARAEIRSNLIRFYYDNDFMRQLTEYLNDLEPDYLTQRQRAEMLELMILTGMYDQSIDWLRRYGCYTVDPKIIMRLAGRAFDMEEDVNDAELAEIAWYAFRNGKYDENMLLYLSEAFHGSVREMRDLFKAAQSFGMETWNLLSRIIVQMLYTGTYLGDQIQLYQSYVKIGTNADIELAFLAQLSYNYFARNEVTDEYLYNRIGALAIDEVEVPIVCQMAYLRFYAEQAKTERAANAEVTEQFLRNLLAEHLYFAFFKNYMGAFSQMQQFADKSILEYRTKPHTRCKVHFMVTSETSDSKDYQEQEMREMYDGLYVTSFILFYGEQLQYYITEESAASEEEDEEAHAAGMQQLTESGTISGGEDTALPGKNEGRFRLINDLIMADTMQDEKTVEKLAGEYYKDRFLVDELFTAAR